MNKFDLRKYFEFNVLLKEEKELLFVLVYNIDNNEEVIQKILEDKEFKNTPPLEYSLKRYRKNKRNEFEEDQKGDYFVFKPYGKIGTFMKLLSDKDPKIDYTVGSYTDKEKEN